MSFVSYGGHALSRVVVIWYENNIFSWRFGILLHVDDMLIGTKDMSKLNKLKSELFKEFDMKDLGDWKDYWHGD